MKANVFSINLTEEQQKVSDTREGTWIVIASPGAGKTTVLLNRHLKMLTSGIPATDMLNLSFTNAAASEMASRSGLVKSDSVFRTFHSFAIDVLKKERDNLSFQVCDTIIPVAMEDYQLLFDLVKIWSALNWRTLREKIVAWKCANVLPTQAMDENRHNGLDYFYSLAYQDYEIKCRKQGWLDFDDCIREVISLFETNEEVRNRWKKKYISIDEGQDTDVCQARLIKLLYDGNLFLVADTNQNVFEWRSASPYSLINFAKTLPGAQILFLGQNFRSTKKLVAFFKEILPVDNGIASHMRSENEEGEDPTFVEYSSEDEEADQVLKAVIDPVNTAIVARTNRQLYIFQRACVFKGIKYRILGKKDFFETNEVKKLLHLAKNSNDSRPAHIVLTDLIQRHDLLHLYQYAAKPTEASPIENLNSLVKLATGKGNIHEFLDRLRKLTHARKSSKGLTLSTVHQIKGMEFDNIFVVGAKQGLMPHKEGEINEEKRILYVACTRAAKKLQISFYGILSEFLSQYKNKVIRFEKEKDNETTAAN